MPSVKCFRQFFNERLSAAAEEIFTVFEKTVIEYEAEINRQRKLLDVFLNPEVRIHRIELPRQHVREEQVLADSQLFNQESSFSLGREVSQPPQIKEEEEVEEGLFPSQDGEELVLKEEPDLVLLTVSYGVDHHNEDQTLSLNNDGSECVDSMPVKISEAPERNTDHQLLPHTSHLTESQEDPVLSANAETKLQNAHQTDKMLKSTMSTTIPRNTRVKKSFKCDTCGKVCVCLSKLIRHQRSHTGVKPYPCDICGKSFIQASALTVHKRIHTGVKPYSCNICSKTFSQTSVLNVHKRIHTGVRPYPCDICGKAFTQSSILKGHKRIHTGERPYSCDICGNKFRDTSSLNRHVGRHAGKKLYLCYTCGKGFLMKSDLINHTISHSNENTCS